AGSPTEIQYVAAAPRSSAGPARKQAVHWALARRTASMLGNPATLGDLSSDSPRMLLRSPAVQARNPSSIAAPGTSSGPISPEGTTAFEPASPRNTTPRLIVRNIDKKRRIGRTGSVY